MVTKLSNALKRELSIEGEPYVLTVTTTGFVLTEKGRRKGFAMDWVALISGDAALATALAASLANAPPQRSTASKPMNAPATPPGKARSRRIK